MGTSGAMAVAELAPAGGGRGSVRLPGLDGVTLTRRVVEVVDHPHFQRLRRVRQLGPTHLVYPGATHSRFEHSLGVYGTTVRYLRSLLTDESVAASLGEADLLSVLMAALLHDLGHYPFAHSLEALHYKGRDTPRHEALAETIAFGRAPGLVRGGRPIAHALEHVVGVDPARVMRLVRASRADLEPTDRLLQSVISSAIDADKMDYLWRDSVHLGVPYGRSFDRDRLLASLTVGPDGDSIAVSAKGLTSAEIFLFCRYTMFSEVYWHHTVRSASAMLEWAWGDLVRRDGGGTDELTSQLLAVGDDELLATLAAEAPPGSAAAHLLHGLTGGRRRLYKRLGTWSRRYEASADVWERIYAMDEAEAADLVERLAARLSRFGPKVAPHALILDVPPRDKDAVPDIHIHHPRAEGGRGSWASLAEASSIVAGIARDFVRVVKKIRLFVDPDVAPALRDHAAVEAAVAEEVLA